jgi:hypothetical protein
MFLNRNLFKRFESRVYLDLKVPHFIHDINSRLREENEKMNHLNDENKFESDLNLCIEKVKVFHLMVETINKIVNKYNLQNYKFNQWKQVMHNLRAYGIVYETISHCFADFYSFVYFYVQVFFEFLINLSLINY